MGIGGGVMNQYDRFIKRDGRSAITAFLIAVASYQQNFAAFHEPLVLSPVTAAGSRSAAVNQEPVRLEPGATIKRDIAGTESHSYVVTLTGGQYLRVVALQQNSDLALKLYSPGGRMAAEVNQLANGSSSKPI